MKRARALLLACVVVAAACASDRPGETTTTLGVEELEAVQLEEDTGLIRALWSARSDAWAEGPETGLQFLADHNYPDMECTTGDYADYYQHISQEGGFYEQIVVHADTIEPDPEWVRPDTGLAPTGRVYAHQITYTDNSDSSLRVVHTAILDEAAYFFTPCRQ